MKKMITLSLAGIALCIATQAQVQQQTEYYKPATATKSNGSATEEYVQVELSPTDWGKNYKAKLEFADKTMTIEEYLQKDLKNKHEYPTTVAVMNALNQLGWEFVNYIPDAEGKLDRHRFLMKRKLVRA